MAACNVLFLCTGNSARSVMAEAILARLGAGRFRAFSAGSHPKGAVHPDVLELLAAKGHPTGGLRSKSWEAFAGPDAPVMDVVLTVCNAAAGETCPIWPGRPATGHWGLPDPTAIRGSAQVRRAAFAETYDQLHARIGALVALPVGALAPAELARRLNQIGREPDSRPGGIDGT